MSKLCKLKTQQKMQNVFNIYKGLDTIQTLSLAFEFK